MIPSPISLRAGVVVVRNRATLEEVGSHREFEFPSVVFAVVGDESERPSKAAFRTATALRYQNASGEAHQRGNYHALRARGLLKQLLALADDFAMTWRFTAAYSPSC